MTLCALKFICFAFLVNIFFIYEIVILQQVSYLEVMFVMFVMSVSVYLYHCQCKLSQV